MTLTCLPINASSGAPAYSAQQSRQAFAAHIGDGGTANPLQTASGFTPGRTPTLSVSGTTLTVGAFAAIIDPGFTLTQGPYEVASDTNLTQAINAANATNPRYDIVSLTVNDTDIDGSGSRNAVLTYTAGTAASSPTVPAVPARSMLLATLYVPASGGGSPSATLSPAFAVAAGGVLPCLTTALPVTPHPGLVIFTTDTGMPYVWTGAVWKGIPLGFQGSGVGPGGTQNNTTGPTQLAAVNVNVVNGRRYRVTGYASGRQSASAGGNTYAYLQSSSGSFAVSQPNLFTASPSTASQYAAGTAVGLYVATATGTITFSVQVVCTVGYFTTTAGSCSILVDDDG